MNVNELLNKTNSNCCGCGGCFAVCSSNAIKMSMCEDGFYKPIIDNNLCSNCSLCINVCYMNIKTNKLYNFNYSDKYYAYRKNGNEVLSSASGGIAAVLMECALSKGWKVLGTYYDYEQNKAITSITNSQKVARSFRSSKYIQAESFNAFKEAIESTSPVIAIGTPCQIYELRMLAKIKKCEEKFLFVDFVCHGVPSYTVYKAYIKKYIKNKKYKLLSIDFRSKINGWKNKTILIKYFDDKSKLHIIQKRRQDDLFFKLYDLSFMMNDCCFNCSINNGLGASDIRLGDYWLGDSSINNDKGISRVGIYSKKGYEFFEEIKKEIVFKNDTKMEYKRDNTYYLKIRQNKKLKEKSINDLNKGYGLKKLLLNHFNSLNFKNKIICFIPKKIKRIIK